MHVVVRRCHVLENHFQTGNEASVLVSKKGDSISEHGNYIYLLVIFGRIDFGVTTCQLKEESLAPGECIEVGAYLLEYVMFPVMMDMV